MMRKQMAKVGALVRRGLAVLGVAAALCLAAGCDDGKTVVDDPVDPNGGGGNG